MNLSPGVPRILDLRNKTYYNHQAWQKGGNASRYVPAEKVPPLKKAIEGYQRFQKLTEQYAA